MTHARRLDTGALRGRRRHDLIRTEWLKALGEGLHEFRVRHDADEIARMLEGELPEVDGQPEKVLLRVFVHFCGQKVVLLLGGYDKGARGGAVAGVDVLWVIPHAWTKEVSPWPASIRM